MTFEAEQQPYMTVLGAGNLLWITSQEHALPQEVIIVCETFGLQKVCAVKSLGNLTLNFLLLRET